MPVGALVDDCPLYDLEPERPAQQVYPAPERQLDSDDARESLLALMASPNLASRRPLFEQYDSIVGSRTVRRPEEADAAVLQLAPDGGSGGIAVAIDGNGRRVACDPYTGTVEAVLECASNLACVGAEPLGLTNCLNFGNPEKPHVAWQLERSVAGMADALRALEVPVVGGNVSLYNESGDGPIYPTPVVGMVGKLPDVERSASLAFAEEGHAVAVCGELQPHLAGARSWQSCAASRCPPSCRPWTWPRSEPPRRPCATPSAAGELASAHDIAERGPSRGGRRELPGGRDRRDAGARRRRRAAARTSSARARAASWSRARARSLERLAQRTPLDVVGTVGGHELAVTVAGEQLSVSLAELRERVGRARGRLRLSAVHRRSRAIALVPSEEAAPTSLRGPAGGDLQG